jgi:hypothetical protein
MPEPIVEQIRQNILAIVASVTTAAGYFQTLGPVESVKRHGNTASDLACFVEMGDEHALDETDPRNAVQHDTFIQVFEVFIHVHDPSDETGFDKKCNRIVSDLRKAMAIDTNRAGLADWTRNHDSMLWVNLDGSVAGVMVPFKVFYKTLLGNPYSQ